VTICCSGAQVKEPWHGLRKCQFLRSVFKIYLRTQAVELECKVVWTVGKHQGTVLGNLVIHRTDVWRSTQVILHANQNDIYLKSMKMNLQYLIILTKDINKNLGDCAWVINLFKMGILELLNCWG
jgi:hypothetical protein